MDKQKLEIEDYYILLNLHKALLEAKFHMNPDNVLVCASPIIADLFHELDDIIAKKEERKNPQNAGRWEEWRKLKNQPFYRGRAVQNAILTNKWLTLKEEEKVIYARNLLSPFVAIDEELIDFIKEIDEKYLGK